MAGTMKYFLILFSLCSTLLLGNNIIQQSPKSSFIDFVEQQGKTLAPSYEKRNCVQFMDAILKEYLNINKNTSERIYIKHDLEFLKKLYYKGDTAIISGVCAALVDCHKADWVSLKDIKRGDVIQYWTDNGFFNGHCGIYWDADMSGNFLLKGSHPDSHGYGVMNMYNKNFKMKIFCVRLI
jgi:hypothetical protein